MEVVTKSGASCSDVEFGFFVSCVRASGEVSLQNLGERIRSAPALVFARADSSVLAVAALKNPAPSYRRRVGTACGTPLPSESLPFELGWVYVLPEARRRGHSLLVTQAALTAAWGAGVFATSRTDNEPMHRSLIKLGFIEHGKAFQSGRGSHSIRVFVRHAAQQTTQERRAGVPRIQWRPFRRRLTVASNSSGLTPPKWLCRRVRL